MLQQPEPDDYVLATGEHHSVEEFCALAFAEVGLPLEWKGENKDRLGIDAKGNKRVCVDTAYFRPTEVAELLGNPAKAGEKLGWTPKIKFSELVAKMVSNDLVLAQQESKGV